MSIVGFLKHWAINAKPLRKKIDFYCEIDKNEQITMHLLFSLTVQIVAFSGTRVVDLTWSGKKIGSGL